MTRPDPTVVDPLPAPTSTPADGIPARPALLAESGADGSVWLVPAYSMTAPDGRHVTVPAIDDSFVRNR
jgi:hypothetical protein